MMLSGGTWKWQHVSFLGISALAYHLKKTVEHRKRVLQRKQVAAQCSDHVISADIMKDRSDRKHISHNHLHSLVQKHGFFMFKVDSQAPFGSAMPADLQTNPSLKKWVHLNGDPPERRLRWGIEPHLHLNITLPTQTHTEQTLNKNKTFLKKLNENGTWQEQYLWKEQKD